LDRNTNRTPKGKHQDLEQVLTRLNKLEKRILLISGDEYHCFLAGAKSLTNRIRNADLHVIEKCGHICSIEKWGAFNQIILEYLLKHKEPIPG